MCGTAAEITPVRSIDRYQVGEGHRGPITEKIQKEFFRIVHGEDGDKRKLAGACKEVSSGRGTVPRSAPV